MAVDLDVGELLIMGDSDLIIRQAQGEWETRDIKLIPYRQHVKDLSKRFKSVEFRYIPRFHNELADALATLASMLPYPGNVHIDLSEIQIRERHGYCNAVEIEPDVQPWCVDAQEAEKKRSAMWAPHERICPCKDNPAGRLLLDDHGKGLLHFFPEVPSMSDTR
ncbi:PREDICTED: uncharacterized protein LOC109225922 [Nicotiana attenuata]|uniref:uncharacterized protein LOC109225922 n=1 Tax=Nicotiana attenuata TaxID=49451 RepID=UPI000905C480|nr:PREDICTED: uncharacterized protein LOC109225922 [Nicotiana attenuata]